MIYDKMSYIKGSVLNARIKQTSGNDNINFLDNDKHNRPHIHVYYGEYEASILLKYPAYQQLKDFSIFMQAYIENGVVTWKSKKWSKYHEMDKRTNPSN